MAESIQKMGILDKVEVEVRIGMEMASLVVYWECFGCVRYMGRRCGGEGRVSGGEQGVVIGLELHGYMSREQICNRQSLQNGQQRGIYSLSSIYPIPSSLLPPLSLSLSSRLFLFAPPNSLLPPPPPQLCQLSISTLPPPII